TLQRQVAEAEDARAEIPAPIQPEAQSAHRTPVPASRSASLASERAGRNPRWLTAEWREIRKVRHRAESSCQRCSDARATPDRASANPPPAPAPEGPRSRANRRAAPGRLDERAREARQSEPAPADNKPSNLAGMSRWAGRSGYTALRRQPAAAGAGRWAAGSPCAPRFLPQNQMPTAAALPTPQQPLCWEPSQSRSHPKRGEQHQTVKMRSFFHHVWYKLKRRFPSRCAAALGAK